MPFVDYHMPLRWPKWLDTLRDAKSAPPTWQRKHDIGLVAFGHDIPYQAKAHKQAGFFDANATLRALVLRHAFYHSCGRQATYDWSGRLRIVGGPESTAKFIPRSEFCRHRYVVLLAGQSSWLDSIKHVLGCGSLIIYIADTGSRSMLPLSRHARDPVMHSLVNGSHWLHYDVDGDAVHSRKLCDLVAGAVQWARQNPVRARAIAERGAQLVRRHWSVEGVYDFVNATLEGLAALQGAEVVNTTIYALHGSPIKSPSDAMDNPEVD